MSKSCGGACGGDATSAADTDIQASSEAPGRELLSNLVYGLRRRSCLTDPVLVPHP